MGSFRNADNLIFLKNDTMAQELIVTMEKFLSVFKDYKLPLNPMSGLDNILMQEYYQGKKHTCASFDTEYHFNIPWKDGDKYIGSIDDFLKMLTEEKTVIKTKSKK